VKESSAKRRIVVLDGYALNPGDCPWDEVAALGELTVHRRTLPEQVVDRCRDADIVLTNKCVVDGAAIGALKRLRYISVLATGYNVVDVAAAAARGIPVSNVPEYGTASVAQFVFALILELAHHIGDHHAAVRQGDWSKGPDYSFRLSLLSELAGKTLAVVGFGRIGRAVGEIAHSFGMPVLAAARTRRDPPAWRPFSWCTVEEAFARGDIVSLNCSLTKENTGMVNSRLLSSMRSGSFLVNTARGGLIVEKDLADALAAGKPAGAALDVLSQEPPAADNPLIAAPGCIITPHIAWATLEARTRLMSATAANIRAFLAGAPVNLVS
jgi:glycerate dehydrogenase